MTGPIDIQLAWRPVIKAMQAATAGVSNRRGLMRELAGIMFGAVEDNFQAQGRPRWADLHPATKAQRAEDGSWPGQILQRTGRLASSITQHWDNNTATVGTNLAYAAIHQLGGKTKPHDILARNKKALAFGGIVVRKVHHPGSDIPARPFLKLTAADQRELYLAAQRYLMQRVSRATFNQIAEYLPY